MVEESSPLLPPAEESIEAETDAGLEPEPESGEPTPEQSSEPGFVCDCGRWMRSACKGLPFYNVHESRRYCVLHYPGKEKSADFQAALDSELIKGDFDFRMVWFPDVVDFSDVEFSENADFSYAFFRAAAFFISATFSAGADFSYATFSGNADFGSATFSAAFFSCAKFSGVASFSYATFSTAAEFSYATFSGAAEFDHAVFHARADFRRAFFNDSVHFFGSAKEREVKDSASIGARTLGKDPSLDLQKVRSEHPNRIAFHTLNLRPHWFVNVDPRSFVFTDVGWEWNHLSIKQEIAALEAKDVSSPNHLLAITCRQLAENAEANNRYEEASNFRYWANDLARRTKWKGWSFWKTDWLHILYWAVSGYGERMLRALGVLAAVWFVFVLLYARVGFAQQPPKASNEGASSATAASMTIEDRIGRPLEFSRALTYSLAVMSLQKPEPRPLTNWAHTLVTLETILGPVQAALLALAIRRKFMR